MDNVVKGFRSALGQISILLPRQQSVEFSLIERYFLWLSVYSNLVNCVLKMDGISRSEVMS